MGCHFCADEAFAIFAILGGIKFIPTWVRGIWARRHSKTTWPKNESEL
jgi:hypothetical protein